MTKNVQLKGILEKNLAMFPPEIKEILIRHNEDAAFGKGVVLTLSDNVKCYNVPMSTHKKDSAVGKTIHPIIFVHRGLTDLVEELLHECDEVVVLNTYTTRYTTLSSNDRVDEYVEINWCLPDPYRYSPTANGNLVINFEITYRGQKHKFSAVFNRFKMLSSRGFFMRDEEFEDEVNKQLGKLCAMDFSKSAAIKKSAHDFINYCREKTGNIIDESWNQAES